MTAPTMDILGGALIDGTGSKPQQDCSLKVENGRIAAIWRASAPRPTGLKPADRKIDAAGKTIMPGLIDAHCHISYGEGRTAEEIDVYGGAEWAAVRAVWNAAKVLRAGVTGICDPGSTWTVAVTARDAIANGMFPGPRIFAAGRHIVADGGFADYFPSWLGMPASAEGVLCPTREEMLREVRRQVKNRVDLIKISGDSQAQEKNSDSGPCFMEDELAAIVQLAHQLGRKTTIHARYAETVIAAVRAKIDWIIHASYMRRQDVGFVRDSGIPLCPTATFTANIVEYGKEVGVDPNYIESKKRELDALVGIYRAAHEAGVELLVGSEAGFSVTPYGEWHARELELMVKLFGLSPLEAITAATRNNARALGWDKEIGLLKPGYRADLLIVDGDPSADIHILSEDKNLVSVFKDGEEVDRASPVALRARMGHERGFNISTAVLHHRGSRR